MGFIDWLTKDKEVKEDEQNQDDVQLDEEENEDNNFNFDDEDDLSSLKELSNSERSDTLNYKSNNYEEDEDNNYSLPNTSNQLDSFSNNFSAPSQNASFTIFKVSDEEDVRQVLRHLSGNSPCIASFKKVRRRDFKYIMKYLQGGLFVMGANMSEWQNDSYILVPKGMAINMQEKSRRKR